MHDGTDKPGNTSEKHFVSRGGEKLRAALTAFDIDVTGLTCADFGANVGGFTDCLLQAGAEKVFAVDTGYGCLAWKLRKDERVVVMERTNALYADPPDEKVNLVVVDVAFTPQRLIIPAAARWLTDEGRIVSLLKPHYELAKMPNHGKKAPSREVLDCQRATDICTQTCRELEKMGFTILTTITSPLRGKGGNIEFLIHLKPQKI
jgi:23S rRNA (cytidine1920-2'-O)/16S rRNA (cytidine1409-2'-O)-methyltransferase